jgi:hypothetical protein
MISKHTIKSGLASILSFLVAATLQAGQVEYFTGGAPDPVSGFFAGTVGFSVSDNGTVAGTLNLGGANEAAFTYKSSANWNLLSSPARGLSITADGRYVSGYSDTLASGMVWDTTNQSLTKLDTLSGFTIGSAISSNGAYVVGFGSNQMSSWNLDGTGATALGNVTGPSWVPTANFGWAGAVSDTGLVGGISGYSNGARVAVIAQAGVAGSTAQLGNGVLDGTVANPYAKVLGMNATGTVLVGESTAKVGGNEVTHGFIVDRGISDNLVDLGVLAGFTQTRAQDISNPIPGFGRGIAVGQSWNGVIGANDYTNLSATIWIDGLGPQLLQTYAANNWGITFSSGYRLATAFGISSDGQFITGSAFDGSGNQVGYLISTNISSNVPEPASIISLLVGTSAVLGLRWRNKRRSIQS